MTLLAKNEIYKTVVNQRNFGAIWGQFLRDTEQHNLEQVTKSFTQSNVATEGLQGYNLDVPAKNLIPMILPLRNIIARAGGGSGNQTNWKAITNINLNNVRGGLGEGQRGGKVDFQTEEHNAKYRTIGLENDITIQAQFAGKNFQDIISLATRNLNYGVMIQEEKINLGGNNSVQLGTTPTPTLAAADGGSLGSVTLRVICVALGFDSYWDVAGFNNGGIGAVLNVNTAEVLGSITRDNADGTQTTFGSGTAQKSSAATVATGGTSKKVAASVTPVVGAMAYAWYVGTTSGEERLNQITTTNSVSITALSDSGAQLASALPSSDQSTSSVVYDGLLYQAFKAGSNATIKTLATGTPGVGTTLTSDGAGGIAEIEDVLAVSFNKNRISPDLMMVSSQEMTTLARIIIANGGAPILRMNKGSDDATSVMGGQRVGSYYNKLTNTEIPIVVHPNMPAGTMLFLTTKLNYDASNLGSLMVMDLRRDYWMEPWPMRTNKYEYGVYYDGVLKHYAPFSMSVITNIAKP